MMKGRLRSGCYWACMVFSAALALSALLMALPQRPPAHQMSVHPAATVPPLLVFSPDSVFNTGSAAQLDALPGIGEVLSQRIVEERESYGAYLLPEDLLLVKGIGPMTLAGMMEALAEPLVEWPANE